MRISDWSSDVCSSDLIVILAQMKEHSFLRAGAKKGFMAKDKLHRLMARGTEFLGCHVAIMCGAMSWVSERNLVSAISNPGGFGVLSCGAMTPEFIATAYNRKDRAKGRRGAENIE